MAPEREQSVFSSSKLDAVPGRASSWGPRGRRPAKPREARGWETKRPWEPVAGICPKGEILHGEGGRWLGKARRQGCREQPPFIQEAQVGVRRPGAAALGLCILSPSTQP